MSVKEEIMFRLLKHMDIFLAGEEANRIIADAKTLKPGEKRCWYIRGTNEYIELQKNRAA